MPDPRLENGARRRRKIRLLVLGAAAAAVAFVALSPEIDAGEWIRFLARQVGILGASGPPLYVLLFVLVAVFVGPAWLMSMTAGFVWGAWTGLLIVTIAVTLGAAVAFELARHAARQRVERLAQKNATFGAIDRAVAAHGWKVVLLLRMSPIVPYTISNYLYGLTAIRFWPYVAATAVGSIPVSFLYVSLGAAGRAAAEGRARSALDWTVLGVGLAATVVVTILVTIVSRRELARHASRMAESAATRAGEHPHEEGS